MKLDWIEFRTESQRFYPDKSLAAHVIGGVDLKKTGRPASSKSRTELQGHRGEILRRGVQRTRF